MMVRQKKELDTNECSYKRWGNNVYSFVLPVPGHRKYTPAVCIEHFYLDSDLKRPLTINGIPRRIYMGCEFDKDGISFDKKYICLDRHSCGENKIKIIDGQSEKRIYEISDSHKTNLALPKMDFAEAVYKHKDEMKEIDFSAFHLILDIIQDIENLELEL